MRIDKHTRFQTWQQNIIFYILLSVCLGLLAWLGQRHNIQIDLSWNQNNTLTETSSRIVDQLKEEVKIEAYINAETMDVKNHVTRIISMYQARSPHISTHFIDITSEPQKTREAGISNNGELIIRLSEKSEHVFPVNEQNISNALQKLLRSKTHQISFLSGHNERDPHSQDSFHFSQLNHELTQRGIRSNTLNIATEGNIPDQTELLIIADPRNVPVSGEIEKILEYIDRGGNLLWLTEPNTNENDFDILAEHLGLELLPGTVVDMNTRLLGIDDPRFALIAEYPPHPITRAFNTLTIFPEARALEQLEGELWDAEPLLETLPRTWTETDLNTSEEISMDPGVDINGPLVISYSMTRQTEVEQDEIDASESDEPITSEQRVIVVGDSDFLSNAYLGQGGNLDLALNIVNWLTSEEQLLDIPARTAPDTKLQLNAGTQTFIAVGYLIALPVLLIVISVLIWRRRKNR